MEYRKAVQLLVAYAKAYYVYDKPMVDDDIYDALYKKVKDYEEKNPIAVVKLSPTQNVGYRDNRFDKFIHSKPMLSISNVYDFNDMAGWYSNLAKTNKNLSYVCEPKYDGVSITILYKNGVLIGASTRGNGLVGEDVTLNVMTIDNVPKEIKAQGTCEVRGEVVMYKDDFEELNRSRSENGLVTYANTRNAASGSLRQKSAEITRSRKLKFHAFDLFGDLEYGTQVNTLERLKELGFSVFKYIYCRRLVHIESAYKTLLRERETLPMSTDGMVIKVNEREKYENIGNGTKSPNWARAYKFPPENSVTTITGLEWGHGKTGAYVPKARFQPVVLYGVTVTKSTLHNYSRLQESGIKIGDKVIVSLEADVHPVIKEVLVSLRTGNEIDIPIPKICATCGANLIVSNKYLLCPNNNCGDKLEARLSHFVGKKGINMQGLGNNTIHELCARGLVKNLSDLFTLSEDDLTPINVIKNSILGIIHSHRGVELWRFISALGINGLSEKNAKILASAFGMNMFSEDFKLNKALKTTSINTTLRENIVTYFTEYKDEIKKLLELLDPKV